jgi:succinyl-diaminopimelate desuccinylase
MQETQKILSELVAKPSLSPEDAGCLDYIQTKLNALGFTCKRIDQGKVSNLWARIGDAAPLIVFAGHTDVVPAGDINLWQSDPFQLTEQDGYLYGRGTQDMKGGLACMLTAVQNFLKQHKDFKGSIGFLLTSGEEGEDYLDGTPVVLEYLKQTQQTVDYCIVGEPSCQHEIGDTVRHGRRGSLHGHITIKGKQGHVAYPDQAVNAIHQALRALDDLSKTRWDEGHADFPETSLQISNINAGTGALNVVPGELTASFNFRYNTNVNDQALALRVHKTFEQHKLDYDLDFVLSGKPFLTEQGELTQALHAAIKDVTGINCKFCTGGGTSDARFIAETGCQVVEFGLTNDRIHQVNERVKAEELETLTKIYQELLKILTIN